MFLLTFLLQQAGFLTTIIDEAARNPQFRAALGSGGLSKLFGPQGYALSYRAFDNVEDGKDKFSIRLVADYPAGNFKNDATIYKKMFLQDIPSDPLAVIHSRSLTGVGGSAAFLATHAASTKEKHFVEFLQNLNMFFNAA